LRQHLNGTLQAPIWFGGAAGQQVQFTNGILFQDCSYLIVHDMDMTAPSSSDGINSYGLSDLAASAIYHIYRNLNMHECGAGNIATPNQNLNLAGVDYMYIINNTFTNSQSLIDMVGCSNVLVRQNQFICDPDYANCGYAVQMKRWLAHWLVCS
jgi:hypothetical protein